MTRLASTMTRPVIIIQRCQNGQAPPGIGETALPITVGGPTAMHIYENPGTYTITMKFTDTEGATATATKDD